MNIRKMINAVVALMVVIAVSGCKIQNAPGAYEPAKTKIEVGSLEPEKRGIESGEKSVDPTPKPAPIVIEPVVTEDKKEVPVYVEEPAIVQEIEVVETKNEQTLPENVRTESFTLVDKADVVMKRYNLVIGSFGQKNNAQNLQSQMRPQYDPMIVINERGLYRVILISYDTYDETRKKIETLRDQFPDAWVLVQK